MRVLKSIVGRLGVVGTAATAVVALATGTAVAYWVTTSSGTATAQAGTAQNPTTSTVAVTSGLLYPGGTGDVFIRITNPNPYAVKVTAVTGTGTITASGGTCTNTAVTFTNQSPTSGNTIAANSSATFTYTGAVAMGTNPDQGCQNAIFTIPVNVTISS